MIAHFKLVIKKAEEMMDDYIQEDKRYSIATKALSSICHNCEICPFAYKKPNSPFGKLMRWHRKWCPAWAAHTKVYGVKLLSQ